MPRPTRGHDDPAPPCLPPARPFRAAGLPVAAGACGGVATDGWLRPTTALADRQARRDRARKIRTQNISLSRDVTATLAIAQGGNRRMAPAHHGERIEIDTQPTLLLEHRTHLIGIAEAGIAIGVGARTGHESRHDRDQGRAAATPDVSSAASVAGKIKPGRSSFATCCRH